MLLSEFFFIRLFACKSVKKSCRVKILKFEPNLNQYFLSQVKNILVCRTLEKINKIINSLYSIRFF